MKSFHGVDIFLKVVYNIDREEKRSSLKLNIYPVKFAECILHGIGPSEIVTNVNFTGQVTFVRRELFAKHN
jgi:hypothetical protein